MTSREKKDPGPLIADELNDEVTYDELSESENDSIRSGSINEILDSVGPGESRKSLAAKSSNHADLDRLLEDLDRQNELMMSKSSSGHLRIDPVRILERDCNPRSGGVAKKSAPQGLVGNPLIYQERQGILSNPENPHYQDSTLSGFDRSFVNNFDPGFEDCGSESVHPSPWIAGIGNPIDYSATSVNPRKQDFSIVKLNPIQTSKSAHALAEVV